jgi:hypothetical protein
MRLPRQILGKMKKIYVARGPDKISNLEPPEHKTEACGLQPSMDSPV